MAMKIDFSKLPSSIKEFFTQEEYDELPEYERMHLTRLRQNFEALKSFGLKPPPPEFMVRKKNLKRSKSPVGKGRGVRVDYSSSDSDEEWTPASERSKDDRAKPFVPVFQPQRKKKTRTVSARKPKAKPVSTKTARQKPAPVTYTYTLRSRPMIKYMSLAVPDEDDFLYCEDCNMEYPGDCPVHGPLLVVQDKDVPEGVEKGLDTNYNLYTLPDGLEVKTSGIPGAGQGVFATKRFPARTRFGPYKGSKEKNEDMAHDSGYCWQIYQNGKPSHFVDAKDPSHSNWMRYVNCARSEDEQCLTAYQHEGEIYYRAHRDIDAGMELLVYYGDNYAKELGIALQKVGQWNRPEKQKQQIPDNVFPCNKCHLAFTTEEFLDRHLHRLHSDEYWRKRRERNGLFGCKGEKECESVTSGFESRSGGVTRGGMEISNDAPKAMDANMSGQKGHECSLCGKIFIDRGNWQTHKRIHSGEKPYVCTVCGKAFSHSSHRQAHMRIHSGEKPYACTVCGKAFSHSSHRQAHMRIHSGEKPYACTVCGKAFSRSNDRQAHMRIHSGEKPYACTVCGKAFSHSSHRQAHMRIHSGEKPYACTVCGKAFSRSNDRQAHMRIHSGEKPYACTVCGKAFSHSSHRQAHMRIHSGEKPYACTVCGKAFSRSNDRQAHMRIHSGEKPYACTVCGKAFSRSNDRQRHMRIHSGEKPYACTVCGKTFSRSSQGQKHMRIHSGEKPYACTVCGKAFSDSRNRQRHMRIHSGEISYACTVCGKAFSQSGERNKHMKTVHTRKDV